MMPYVLVLPIWDISRLNFKYGKANKSEDEISNGVNGFKTTYPICYLGLLQSMVIYIIRDESLQLLFVTDLQRLVMRVHV